MEFEVSIMKKCFVTLLMLLAANFAFADSILIEGFEYGNHEGEVPVGWVCDDNTWGCGYLQQDHNRIPHSGNWYAYTSGAESWMFMSMHMSTQLKYRFSLWAISDGGFQLEIWAGNEANPNAMTQLMLNDTVSSGNYEKFSAYIEELTSDFEYFGIHAVSAYGDYVLTIDDVIVDMVGKYDITVNPPRYDTYAIPGSQVEFSCVFINLGYEPANTFITGNSDYFTDVHLFKDGEVCTSFHAEPDESVEFTGIATLKPNIEAGEWVFVDIFFTLDCDCATAMFTLWVKASYESTDELSIKTISIYPNPSSGNVTIEGNGLVTITNAIGQVVLTKEVIDKETITLEKGVYFVKIKETTLKIVVQ